MPYFLSYYQTKNVILMSIMLYLNFANKKTVTLKVVNYNGQLCDTATREDITHKEPSISDESYVYIMRESVYYQPKPIHIYCEFQGCSPYKYMEYHGRSINRGLVYANTLMPRQCLFIKSNDQRH